MHKAWLYNPPSYNATDSQRTTHKVDCSKTNNIKSSSQYIEILFISMGKPTLALLCFLTAALMAVEEAGGFVPYTRPPWDTVLPADDPFRILEQTPLTVPRGVETVALARVDWKETPSEHVIWLDVPGMRREDVKVEVEENRVLRIGGERKAEEAAEGERWHIAERISGKFWRQFRVPVNADLDGIKARLEDGVLKITVPKLAEERRRQPKVITISEETPSSGGEAEIKVEK